MKRTLERTIFMIIGAPIASIAYVRRSNSASGSAIRQQPETDVGTIGGLLWVSDW